MRRALETMYLSRADWVYPMIDKFGIDWSGDFSPKYSVFRHLFQNICEAGSLIHRRVFDAGISFDESMRQGYEDWEFWLQCADAGFRGVPCQSFGFQYRARRESMVRESDRVGDEILAYMHRKHKRLFSWKSMLRLEHMEGPRFCVIDTAHRRYAFTSIPGESSSSGNLVDLDGQFWGAEAFPAHIHFPNFIIVADDRVLRELARVRIIDWVFWQIEDLLEKYTFVQVGLAYSSDATSIEVRDGRGGLDGSYDGPYILATTLKCCRDVANDPLTIWVDTLKGPKPEPAIASLLISAPVTRDAIGLYGAAMAMAGFFDFLQQMRASKYKQAGLRAWEWRAYDALLATEDLYLRTRKHMHAQGPLGRCALKDEREVAFLLPVLSFGGVEQVAIQVAKQFRLRGWRTRVIITEGAEIKAPDRLSDAFDTFLFLNDPGQVGWHPSGLRYYGHDLQKWATEGTHDRLTALVAGCAVVVACQAMHGNDVMGWLRRQGVITVGCLHLIDRDRFMAPVGHPYLMLAYEHAYDYITAPSSHLLRLCHSLGVPSEKLICLANAPTFEVEKTVKHRRVVDLEVVARDADPNRRLRVLYMGRLDRQKGLDRLTGLIRACNDEKLPIDWRLVGANVLVSEGVNSDVAGLENVVYEPPVYQRSSVIERLLWADVSVLLSYWEGSPLSILEAQSLGVIPLVTHTGAVDEMIESHSDGIIINNGAIDLVISQALDHLRQLALNAPMRQRIAINAIRRASSLSWSASAKMLIDKIDARLLSAG